MNRKSPLSRFSCSLCLASLLLLYALWFLPSALAQGVTATLTGTVQDQNGAVVPGAMVTVLNPSTALERHATTTDDGYFTIPLLPSGTYSVTARRDGFSPVEFRNVVLNAGDQKALNIQLKAGDVNATVTVDSNAETVRTDGSVGTVINRQFVANMPLNGRTLQALIQLTPGVVLTSANVASTITGSAQFSVNGQRTTSNYFMVDGVSANTGLTAGNGVFSRGSGSGQVPGTTALGGTNSLVSLDALQEFRIETSTFAAEYGRTPGGQISLLTRSGTNQFHGSASYYFRNEALDANDWFANSRRLPKPKERQSFFGGVLGGPIKRDRLFFFGSYEGLRLKQPQVQITTVPTVALRAQAPSALRPYLNALPLPNGQDFGDGTAQFAGSYSDAGSFNIFSLRLDGRVTDSITGFFRVSHAPSETNSRIGTLSTVQNVQIDNNSNTGGLTWVAGSHVTADLRLNWSRNAPRVFSDLDSFGGAVIPAVSDVFRPGWDPSTVRTVFFAIGANFTWGHGNSDVQRQFNTVGTVAWSVGSHQLKLGVDYRRLLPQFGATGGSFEALQFNTSGQILAGRPVFYQLANSDPVQRKGVIANWSLFAQDAWRVSRRLTWTYGLRLERVPPPTEATGRLPRTLLGIENDVLQNPRLAPQGTPLFRSRFGSFAPRFGVAYQLSARQRWETTLRGGAGIFYDLGLGDITSAFQFVYPFVAAKVSFNLLFPSETDRTPPVPGSVPPAAGFFLLDPNLRLPYTVQWNVTWEQGIGKAQTVTLGYVGASGRRLLIQQSYRPLLADFPTVPVTLQIMRNLGSSSYSALQVQYQRRLNRGFQALASYTLGTSQDNTSDQSALAPPANQGTLLAGNFGPSDFDVRHVLSAAVTYDLPKISGPAVLRTLLNDWGLDLLVRYQSAFPLTPTAGVVSFPDGAAYRPRPDVVSGQPLYINASTVPGGRRFNRAAFAFPAPGQQGNFPRNGLRGFPASQMDLAVRREFKLKERVRLQLRGELFNLLNHPNFGAPNSDIASGQFGLSGAMLSRSLGGLNALYQMGGSRSGQLAVRVIW